MNHIDDATWQAILNHPDANLHEPASADAIARAERELSIALPEAHREFLLKVNGGVVGFARVFGVGRDDYFDLARRIKDVQPHLDPGLEKVYFPFANDWGGNYFCYDLRCPPMPEGYPVSYWNHEFAESPEDQDKLWWPFAKEFIDFLHEVVRE
jgi:hypothetical protein